MHVNMSKVQQLWVIVAKVFLNTGAMVRAREMMHKVVVQMVLVYGSDIWVVINLMLKML